MTITITVEKDGYYEVNGVKHEPTVSLYVIPAASKLRRMLKDTKDLIVCPGVYDGLSARIAMELGFKALYMVRPDLSITANCVEASANEAPVTDRSWHNGFTPGYGRSCPGWTARYANQCGDDCQPRSIRSTLDCRHGYRLWR